MAGKINKIENAEVDAAQIAAWLKDNPNFFIDHPASLTALELPVDAGPAISLHQYQVRVLREGNTDLKRKIGMLVKNVKTNHKIHSDLLDLAGNMVVLAKQGATTETYLSAIKKYFSLFDVLYIDREEQLKHYNLVKKVLGKQDSVCSNDAGTQLSQALFGDDALAVLSMAMVPVVQGRKCVAYLVLAADDAARFKPGMGGEFLKLLARLVANISHEPAKRG